MKSQLKNYFIDQIETFQPHVTFLIFFQFLFLFFRHIMISICSTFFFFFHFFLLLINFCIYLLLAILTFLYHFHNNLLLYLLSHLCFLIISFFNGLIHFLYINIKNYKAPLLLKKLELFIMLIESLLVYDFNINLVNLVNFL